MSRRYPFAPGRQYHGLLAIPLGDVAAAPSLPGSASSTAIDATTPAAPVPAPTTGSSTWTAVDYGILGAMALAAVGIGGLLFTDGKSLVAKILGGVGAAGATALYGYSQSGASTPAAMTSGVLEGRYYNPLGSIGQGQGDHHRHVASVAGIGRVGGWYSRGRTLVLPGGRVWPGANMTPIGRTRRSFVNR